MIALTREISIFFFACPQHFDRIFLNQIAKQTPNRESFLIQGKNYNSLFQNVENVIDNSKSECIYSRLGPHEETCHSCGRSPVQGFLYKCCDCGYNGCHRCQSINGKCIVTGNNHLLFRFADPLNLNVRNSMKNSDSRTFVENKFSIPELQQTVMAWNFGYSINWEQSSRP